MLSIKTTFLCVVLVSTCRTWYFFLSLDPFRFLIILFLFLYTYCIFYACMCILCMVLLMYARARVCCRFARTESFANLQISYLHLCGIVPSSFAYSLTLSRLVRRFRSQCITRVINTTIYKYIICVCLCVCAR